MVADARARRRVEVRVIPRARRRAVERRPEGSLVVRVTEPPEDGRANDAVLDALAEHFGVRRAMVRIVRGAASRRKVVEISPPRD